MCIRDRTRISNKFTYFAFGFEPVCRLLAKYSLKKRYNAGTEALASRKSSGILK